MINSMMQEQLVTAMPLFTYSVSSHGPLRLASLSLNRALIEATAASIIFSCSNIICS